MKLSEVLNKWLGRLKPLTRTVLLCCLLVCALPAGAAAADCPYAALRGTYRNHTHGFVVQIPAPLAGYWNSAACTPGEGSMPCICMGDHGRDLPLDGGGAITIFASFINPDGALATALYHDIGQFEQQHKDAELSLQEFRPMRHRGMAGYRYLARIEGGTTNLVREVVLLQTPSGSNVWMVIEASEVQYKKYLPAYRALMRSFRLAPRG